jgi:hypothetical protein
MGLYAEYLDQKLDFQQITGERKQQLLRISKLRGDRDVLVFAANLGGVGRSLLFTPTAGGNYSPR